MADCPEFEDWLREAREKLAADGRRALQALIDAQRAAGRHAGAAETAQRLAALDPWDEAAQRQLMSVLAEGGRGEQAMGVYERLRASLAAELGSEPERATRALHESIAAAPRADRRQSAAPFTPGLGHRRWAGLVYCQWRGNVMPADELAARLHDAGGHVLATTGRGVLAGFVDAAGTARSSLAQAARAALSLHATYGDALAIVLCSGLLRTDGHGGALALVGNPMEWAHPICERAAGGDVLLCDAVATLLRNAFEAQQAGHFASAEVSQPVALWRLIAERADAACADDPREAVRGARQDGDTDRVRRAANLRTEPVHAATAAIEDGPAVAWLTVVDGTDRGKRVGVGMQPVVVGRASDADLQIAHGTVSRHHCVCWLDGHAYRLRDLGATNRTRVNGGAVQDVRLEHGDEISLGDSLLRFERRLDPPTVPIARAG